MDQVNGKVEWIKSLFIARSTMDIETDEGSSGRITFVTNFGFISGELYELLGISGSTVEEIAQSLKSHLPGGVDIFSIAEHLYNKNIETKNVFDAGKQIILKNVEIMYSNDLTQPIDIPMMAVFVDEIVGVIPAKVSAAVNP